jgi:hypothetical protein
MTGHESEIPLEKRFRMLAQIQRASHFEWLRAVRALCPDVDEKELVLRFWTEVGHDTARNYVDHMDPAKPMPRQMAESFVFSSQCMGEDAVVVEGGDDRECFARHDDCPWLEWHRREGKTDLDQAGCDRWLEVLVGDVNEALGTDVKWETVKAMPAGDEVCLRRFWVE